MNNAEILSKFVSCFELDSKDAIDSVNVISCTTDKTALNPLYSLLPTKFPRLYEQLVLSYRWKRSIVGPVRLLANPAGPDLIGLKDEICADKHLYDTCVKNGFIHFGFAASGIYDPVCFDTNDKPHRKNPRIVTLDHEELLCNAKIRVQSILARNFDELVVNVIRTRESRTQP